MDVARNDTPQAGRRYGSFTDGLVQVLRVCVIAVFCLSSTDCTSPRDKPNIVLISIDDLRSDHLGCYGHSVETSPAIDALAARGVRFTNAFTAAPWTLPSHLSIFTSLYPSEHGVNPVSTLGARQDRLASLPTEVVTFPEILQRHGYATAAFTNAVYLKGVFGFARGFDVYHETETEKAVSILQSQLFQWLRARRGGSFFVFLHTFEVHVPFRPPRAYIDALSNGRPTDEARESFELVDFKRIQDGTLALTPELLDDIKRFYDAEIRYVDDLIGALVHELAQLDLLQKTVIIVTSDHGEEFHEHGAFGHGSTLYDEVLRIPLVIAGPGIQGGRTVDSPVSTVDIMPTILDIAGIRGQRPDSRGVSLAGVLRLPNGERDGSAPELRDDRVLYAETVTDHHLIAIMQDGYTAIYGGPSPHLFDRRHDPLESQDLAATNREMLARFDLLLAEYRRRVAARQHTTGSLTIDSATKKRLQALGYVDE